MRISKTPGITTWTAGDASGRADGLKAGAEFRAKSPTGPVAATVSGLLLTNFGDRFRFQPDPGQTVNNPALVKDPVWGYALHEKNVSDFPWPRFSANAYGKMQLDPEGRVVSFKVTGAPTDFGGR